MTVPDDVEAPEPLPLSAFWDNVTFLAGQHVSTADLWQNLRDVVAERFGPDTRPSDVGLDFQAVNRMRGMATNLVRSQERFAKLSTDAIIGGNNFADTPWSASQEAQNMAPRHVVTYTVGEGDQQQFRTITYWGGVPEGYTKDDVLNDIQNEVNRYRGIQPDFPTEVSSVTLSTAPI